MLEARYERFAMALLTESSQSAALRKSHRPAADWPARKVHVTASEWAARPDVRGRVAELQQRIAREVVLERADVIRQIHALATSDIRGIIDKQGKLKLPHELDAHTAAGIAKFKMTVDGTIEYTMHPKVSALDQACKILGLYERDNNQKTDPLTELLKNLNGRVFGVTADSRPGD